MRETAKTVRAHIRKGFFLCQGSLETGSSEKKLYDLKAFGDPCSFCFSVSLFQHLTSAYGSRRLLKLSYLHSIQRVGKSPSFKDSFKKLLIHFPVTSHWPKLRHMACSSPWSFPTVFILLIIPLWYILTFFFCLVYFS